MEKMPWHDKFDRAVKLAKDYEQRRINVSTTFAQAQAEGWHLGLLDYVRQVAMYQAMKIEGVPNIGVDWGIVANYPHDGWEENQKTFRHRSKEAVQRGFVDVSIPTWVIERAKSKAERLKQKEGEKDSFYNLINQQVAT